MSRPSLRKKRQLPSSDEDDLSAGEQTPDEPAAQRSRQRAIPDEDDEGEDEVDVEEEDEDEEEEEEEESDYMQYEGEEDAEEESASPALIQPRLKITLKLPAPPASSTSNPATPVPEEARKTSRGKRKRSFQDDNDDDDFDEDVPSSAMGTPGGSKNRTMTTRQAVLASVVDSTHVSLDDELLALSPNKGKKKQLNEAELALRREETARKRKNLTEKKLQDEKAETINRLLKKQTRGARGKKQGGSGQGSVSTPKGNHSGSPVNGEDEDAMEVDEEGTNPKTPPPAPPPPVMYRWVCTSRSPSDGEEMAPPEQKFSISFSVPLCVLPLPTDTDSKTENITNTNGHTVPAQKQPAHCDVDGCSSIRKYRLVKDWNRGACSMPHLKVLEHTAMSGIET